MRKFFQSKLNAENEPVVKATSLQYIKVRTGASQEEPIVVDSTNSLLVDFGTVLDKTTVIKDNISIYHIKKTGEIENIKYTITYRNNPTLVSIELENGSSFLEGEEYKIEVTEDLKTANGFSLSNRVEYVAINYSFNFDKIDQLNGKRNLTVCISDLHLGFEDAYAETKNNKEPLLNFLTQINNSPNVEEVVIVGDLFDEWYIPGEIDTFGGNTQQDFLNSIKENNSAIISAINDLINNPFIKVTYVPGNHDLLFTENEIDFVLPGIIQKREDSQGLGTYSPDKFPKTIIEHCHRYDFACSPDPISKPGSLLPPGYFFTRIATSAFVQGYPTPGGAMGEVTSNNLGLNQELLYDYWVSWQAHMLKLTVNESFDEKFIITNIDGYIGNYSINEAMPYQNYKNGIIDNILYKGIEGTWDARQDKNNVMVKSLAKDAIANVDTMAYYDEMANVQYFRNPNEDKRIVVFGHTHEPRILTYTTTQNEKAIYANTGTWIDNNPNYPTMTFVVLIPPKDDNSFVTFVNLYKYLEDGSIQKLDAQAITHLDK